MNSKNMTLTALLLFFITLEVLIALDYISKQKELANKSTLIYSAVIELQYQIGYSGFMHNFKNAILRPEEDQYRLNALKNYRSAIAKVEEIELQSKNILRNLSMPHTKDMLNAYKERLEFLPELFQQNLTAREVDQYVRYDDSLSYYEITQTSKNLIEALEQEKSETLYSSLRSGLITLFALLFTLIAIIKFFFSEQQKALKHSNNLNKEMSKHKHDLIRSQEILLSVMQDVEKEKHQTALLNKQLVDKNKEMEQFIYTVSHDLKSPLVTIGAFTQKLMAELAEVTTEKQAHRFQRILHNVNNMDTLLADLLDLSRIVQLPITFENIDVKDVIEEQCSTLEAVINQSKASIQIAEHLHFITANPRLLNEAILNLLTNAIRYKDAHRPLVVEFYTTRTAKATSLHVKDNGIGIEPKYHELIFGIFERLPSPETLTEGTGVGLTIVKTIMDKHKGEVLITSELGEGACFTLVFPHKKINETHS